jgi:hypothetical protein
MLQNTSLKFILRDVAHILNYLRQTFFYQAHMQWNVPIIMKYEKVLNILYKSNRKNIQLHLVYPNIKPCKLK